MPENIRVIRRAHKDKAIPLPVPHPRPWSRSGDDNQFRFGDFEAVDLKTIEYCTGCGEKMTVARIIVWLSNDQGDMRRLGPCHPSCQEMAQSRFPRCKLIFHRPNDLGRATA